MSKTVSLAALTVAAAVAIPALAQEKPADFPERPLTMIVPYGAGGGSDQLSRAMATAMEETLGQPIQVVNKPGGGGMAAVPDFMTAPADGYTLLESIDDAVTNHVSGKLAENPAADWEPLCMAQVTFSQVYIRPDDDRFSDWESFVAYAKDNQVSVANVGNIGSMERINMLKIEQALGFQSNQIAFDKPAERYAALIGGQVDALFEQPGDVRNFLDADQMTPILSIYPERPGAFADVPTHVEAGADFEALLRFRGFYIHPDVPEDRKRFLEATCKQGFDSAGFQEFNESKYMTLIDSYRDTAGSVELINKAAETYAVVYKELGLTQ
ncbi:MAG: tripartite tricarboxylate transporter substrate binding protein [Geminicoccaceae bacterium]